jgi:iron complex outermembrane recepter protein
MQPTYIRILISLFIVNALALTAFSGNVHISIKDRDKTPMVGATVQLIAVADSAMIYSTADQSGIARFDKLNQGLYIAHVTYIGFQPVEKTFLVNNDALQLDIILSEDVLSLGEVTVTARRPLIRQEDDKMIIDPEPLANISTNTLEILESTPGLFVDPDGGIFLSSTSPATILINGREQKMSSQDINTILRNLPPGSVQYIEVIRTPSARYAASSSGGLINIVLKRGMKIGRFGTLTSGMNQGVYGNQFAGFSMNNGGDKTSAYLNVNVNNSQMLEELSSSRLLGNDRELTQVARTTRKSQQAYAGYGLSLDASQRLVFSYDGRINGSLPTSASNNNNLIFGLNNQQIAETDNAVNNESDFLNIQQDLGMTFKIDSLGSEWDTKLSYSYNHSDARQMYRNGFLFPFAAEIIGNGDNRQRRHYLQFQSDFTYTLPWDVRLETGINSSLQAYDSRSDFFRTVEDQQQSDPLRTNAFIYEERINAAYVQGSRSLPGKFLLKAGLRMEHTYMSGKQTIPADTSFLVNRADWFPYVYLSRPIVQIAGYDLRGFMIYRKTITRPGYQSLNPYVNYIDEFLYESGNPGLNPQFADNIEANISFDDMPIFAIGRNFTRNIFSSVVYQDANQENVAVRTFDNLGKNRETYFRAVGAIPPGGRYFFVFGTQYNLNEYDGVYENQPLSYTRGSWRFFTFHTLRLGKDTRLTLNGFMMTNGMMNFYELDTFGQLNLGLNQTFLNKKLTVTLSARDVLRTMTTNFQINQGNIISSGSRYSDYQRFGINIRYTFGIPNRQERQNIMPFNMEE